MNTFFADKGPPPYTQQQQQQQQYPPPQGGYPPQYPPPQAGYQPPPQQGQHSSVVVLQQPGVVRAPGSCPFCGVGFSKENYTILGLLIAFLFFPLGIICCLMMTERRCTHCRARM